MERKKYFIIGLFIFLLPVKSEAENYRSRIYKAYIEGDMNHWKKVIEEMEVEQNKSDAFILQLLNYQFGYIGWCLSQNDNSQAKKYIDAAQENIETLEKHHYKPATVNAYKSAVYGLIVGVQPVKAIYIGPKSVEAARLSMQQDSTNPNGYIQYGNVLYNMPGFFGGSKQKAIQYYLKALKLMNQKKESYREDWNYLSLLSAIAQAYEKTEQHQKAYKYYQLILQTEPRFSWVKEKLFPEFLKKNKAYVR